MGYQAIHEDDWGVLCGSGSAANKIRGRCEKLVSDLKAIFDTVDIEQTVSLKFEEPQVDRSDILALLRSPIGEGRLRLAWCIDESKLAGAVHVEKKTLTPDDQCVWVPTWGIIVPEYGNPYAGTGTRDFQILYDRMLGHDLSNSLFACGMSMLYAIAIDRPGP